MLHITTEASDLKHAEEAAAKQKLSLKRKRLTNTPVRGDVSVLK